MTVAELIKELSNMDQDAPIIVSHHDTTLDKWINITALDVINVIEGGVKKVWIG